MRLSSHGSSGRPRRTTFVLQKSTFQERKKKKMRKTAQRERSDTHDPRRGCAGTNQNAQKRTAGALRHARSPQRVRGHKSKCAKTHSGSAPTRTIPAEGALAQIQMRKNAQRERSDTHDPRRGCAATNPNAQERTAGALRHARSPQRVRGDKSKCAQRERPDTHDPRRGVHRASRGETHPSLRNKREFNRGGDVMVLW